MPWRASMQELLGARRRHEQREAFASIRDARIARAEARARAQERLARQDCRPFADIDVTANKPSRENAA